MFIDDSKGSPQVCDRTFGNLLNLGIDGVDENPPNDVSHYNASGTSQCPPKRRPPLVHQKSKDNRRNYRATFDDCTQRWPKKPVKGLGGNPKTPIETHPRWHLQQMAERHRHAERGEEDGYKAPRSHW